MKKTLKIICAVAVVFLLAAPARCITPYFGKFYNTDGSPLTNVNTMQAWPPTFTWTVYGTNVIYGGQIITNTPNSVGYFSNSAYANAYRVFVPDLNSYFYLNLLDTTNVLNLALCLSNAPLTANLLTTYGIITNLLGFAPATNGAAVAVSQLPYAPQPATATLTNLSSLNGAALTNIPNTGLQFSAATNGGPLAYSQLPYTPPTNTFLALSNLLNLPGSYTNVVFLGQGTTNTGYFTNGILRRITTP